MKTKYLLAAAAATFALLSCNKESQEVDVVGNDGMTILASIEDGTKTTIGSIKNDSISIVFTSADELRVLGKNSSDQYKVAQFTTSQQGRDKKKKFTCTDETFVGYTPLYAVSSSNDVKFNSGESLTATAKVNNKKLTYRWVESYPENSTLHIGTVTDNKVSLKNVCSLLGFKLAYKNVTSIKFKANDNKPLGGTVTIGLNGYIVNREDADNTELTLNVRKGAFTDNVFPNETYFYIPILPGTYSGFTFTLFRGEDTLTTIVIDKELSFQKGEYRNITTPLGVITVDFDMSNGWPFDEVAPKSASTRNDYTLKGTNYKIGMCPGENNNQYSYSKPTDISVGYLSVARKSDGKSSYLENCFYFELKPIEGYKLWSIGVRDETSKHSVYLRSDIAKDSDGKTKKENLVCTLEISQGVLTSSTVDCNANTPYYLFRNSPTAIKTSRIQLKYYPVN